MLFYVMDKKPFCVIFTVAVKFDINKLLYYYIIILIFMDLVT